MPKKLSVPVSDEVKILSCSDCGVECSSSYGVVNDEAYCDRCFDKNFRECSDCGKLCKKSDGKFHKRKFYCTECYDIKHTECEHCSAKLAKEDALEHAGVLYCKTCFSELFGTCESCGIPVPKADLIVTPEGKQICPTCHALMTVECVECHAIVRRNVAAALEGELYCQSCYNEISVECDHCNAHIHVNNSHEDEFINLCDNCYSSNYYTCDSCGNFVYSGDAVSRGERVLCPDCAPLRDIYEYSYKPSPRFYGGTSENAAFMGIELECDRGGEDGDRARKVTEIANSKWKLLYCKHDGSLSNGFEMVSYPCTLDWHINKFPWEKMLKTCKSLGYQSHDSGTCGLHVHISRQAFGASAADQDVNIMKLLFFFEKFWTKMVRFSRRTEAQLSRWAKKYGMRKTPQELLNTAKGSERYYAVNLQNSRTIELRLFRGTLKYSTFIATLQFCHELVRVLNELPVDKVVDLSWMEFISSLNVSEYKELGNYLERRGLASDPMVTTIEREDTDTDD